MKFELKESSYGREWNVEAIGSDGEIYVAIFSGPLAQERANEYAAMMNKKQP